MRFAGTSPAGPIYITGRVTAPEDGFTCYSQAGFGPACRWGDYFAASSDGAGHIVMADEMIPNAARATDGNWGTFVSVLRALIASPIAAAPAAANRTRRGTSAIGRCAPCRVPAVADN